MTYLSKWLRILALIATTEWAVVPEAIPLGLQTVRNRQATNWWTDEQVISAYHGLDLGTEPLSWTWDLAWQAMQVPGDSNGYLFALSKRDIRNKLVPLDNHTICNGHWCVIFLREFPEESCNAISTNNERY